jgi:membrane-associated protease RseP (regulator of RpoE activity)
VLFGVLLMGFGVAQASTTVGSVSACALPATSERQACEPGDPAAPGAAAGIEPGDRIVSVAGEPIESWNESTAIIRAHPDEPVAFVVERDGETVELEVTPMLSERYVFDDKGRVMTDASGTELTEPAGFVGIGPATEIVQQPVTAVLPTVGENVAGVAGIILNLPQRIIDVAGAAFGPEERDPNGPMSVVGVGRLAGEIATIDEIPIASKAATMIGILGSLNIALFVFNLIPLLPLDGGHIAGGLWEGIKRGYARVMRRPEPNYVDIAKVLPLTYALAFVMIIMAGLLVYADLINPLRLTG